jgi:hypothetical protein
VYLSALVHSSRTVQSCIGGLLHVQHTLDVGDEDESKLMRGERDSRNRTFPKRLADFSGTPPRYNADPLPERNSLLIRKLTRENALHSRD